MKIVNRENGEIFELKYTSLVKFLYNNFLGRILLKLMTTRNFARIGGAFFNSRLSIIYMNNVIKKKAIDMTKYENINYNSYNKFFTRKYKKEYLNVCENSDIFISPVDAKLMILKIDEHDSFIIKNSYYKLSDIINDDKILEYKNGYLLIFRLDVNDYHHYCYLDNGNRSDYTYVNGILHTVQPIVYDKEKVFARNAREWCVLHTKNFGDIIQVEVGALLVGKIVNDKSKINFKKGEEKGFFEFGGSTILLFVKDDVVEYDDDIVKNSKNGMETIVKYGEKIGKRKING